MEKRVDALLKKYESKIYKDLEKIININSFSHNIDGLHKAAKAIMEIGSTHNINFDMVYSKNHERPHLVYGAEKNRDFYTFVGHFDTVHPPQSNFSKYLDKGDVLIGPGMNDMKSGLLVALYSMVVLKELFPDKDLPIKIIFNSDEEIGSHDSEEIIQKEAVDSIGGFVFEPGRVNNEIVTRRKGVCTLDIKVIGKPAHSGVAPQNGINAIHASCEIIEKLNALNDFTRGITIGCNQMKSGIARNVVAPISEISVDIRISSQEQVEPLFEKIKEILEAPNSIGAKVEYDLQLRRLPLEKNEVSSRFAKKYIGISKQLGYECEELATGGGSDGNLLYSLGVPTIDGLGAVGDHSHTKEEYTKKDSLLYRTKIFTLFMSQLLEEAS